ncbi:MAG: efflux RND transporter periplasmic adaptor subunit [Cyanobacteria bacterium]|nr:efflux RND transporter periplasmic adaptor subunit [Cyanobacteriota bacterium]
MTQRKRDRTCTSVVTLRQIFVAAMFAVPVAIGSSACRGAEPTADAPAATAAGNRSPNATSGVRLQASQLKEVRIEELSNNAPANAIKATGTVEFNADRTAKLLPPVSGQVQNLAVNVGDTVRKNDVLFLLSSREVAAAVAEHQTSHKDFDLAEKIFARTSDLFEHQAASRMALEQSENERAKARSRVVQTEENLQVLGLDPRAEDETPRVQPRIPVRTPIDGTVIERNVTNGQFVGSETSPLVTIADLSSVWLQGDIFERDLRHISIGQKADVTTAAYPSDQFSAQVSRIASVVDSQTRTAKVRFLVANPGARLKPGMFASITLYLSDAASSLSVPAKAVFVENGRMFTYVQTGPQEFARREVETVASGSDRLRVVRGLKAGDRVISDGVLLLRQLEAESSAR